MSLASMMSQQQPMPEEMPPAEAEAMPAKKEPAKATPVDQEAYDRVVTAGMTLLNTKAVHTKIFNLLKTGKDSPAKTLGNAALQLMAILKEKSPRDIPETVVGSAAIEIMMMLAEEADAAGIFTVDEQTLKGAGAVLIRGLASMYNIPREEMEAVARGGQGAAEEPPAEEAAPAEQPPPGQMPMSGMRQSPGILNRGGM